MTPQLMISFDPKYKRNTEKIVGEYGHGRGVLLPNDWFNGSYGRLGRHYRAPSSRLHQVLMLLPSASLFSSA